MYYLFLICGGMLIGLIVAAPIGPVNLICIRRTFTYGPINGFFAGLGAAFGDGLFAIITAFGLTAIAQLIEGYSTPLKLIGGLMLVGFGLHIFRSDVSAIRDAERTRETGPPSLFRSMASSFALTITNPATLFGFTALFAGLAGLAGREPSFVDAAIMVVGVFIGSSLWWFILTTFVGILHHRIDAEAIRRINHFFGIAVTGFGVIVLGNLALGI
jgi:threonine/homoserine/homoserine lactone efflux protein